MGTPVIKAGQRLVWLEPIMFFKSHDEAISFAKEHENKITEYRVRCDK